MNPSSSPRELTPAGKWLFFVANDIQHGTELWATDGTETGTRLVRDIYPGSPSSNPHFLTAFNDQLYFAANDGNFGEELWHSDGTEAGARMVSDLNLNQQSSAPHELTVDGKETLYFVAVVTDKGNCIFALNSANEIQLISLTDHRPPVWNPHELRVWNSWLYFSADDGIHGEELWRTNGKETVLVRDIVPEPLHGAAPRSLIPTKDALFFCANDGAYGEELWRLDACNEVHLVCDVRPTNSYLPFRR